jgi:hypothetical protein
VPLALVGGVLLPAPAAFRFKDHPMRHGALLSIFALIAVLLIAPVWAGEAPPNPVPSANPGNPTLPPNAAPAPDVNRRKEDEEAQGMAEAITTAGPIDLLALLTSARNPLSMLNKGLTERLEEQAQALAKDHPEIALARALLLVALETTRGWNNYTAATNEMSTAMTERTNAQLHAQKINGDLNAVTRERDAIKEEVGRGGMKVAELQRQLSDEKRTVAKLRDELAQVRALIPSKDGKDGLRVH